MKVYVKSDTENWIKEITGLKPNTVRVLDGNDTITVLDPVTKKTFTRKIKDITIWKGIIIYSWDHEPDVKIGVI